MICIVFFCLFLPFKDSLAAKNCSEDPSDSDWIGGEGELDDYCYLNVAESLTWQGANDYCIGHGGHLTSIHSVHENEMVKGDNWIGLIKSSTHGQFHWADMTPVEFVYWADGGKELFR